MSFSNSSAGHKSIGDWPTNFYDVRGDEMDEIRTLQLFGLLQSVAMGGQGKGLPNINLKSR
jgi:hypothetical protein